MFKHPFHDSLVELDFDPLPNSLRSASTVLALLSSYHQSSQHAVIALTRLVNRLEKIQCTCDRIETWVIAIPWRKGA